MTTEYASYAATDPPGEAIEKGRMGPSPHLAFFYCQLQTHRRAEQFGQLIGLMPRRSPVRVRLPRLWQTNWTTRFARTPPGRSGRVGIAARWSSRPRLLGVFFLACLPTGFLSRGRLSYIAGRFLSRGRLSYAPSRGCSCLLAGLGDARMALRWGEKATGDYE